MQHAKLWTKDFIIASLRMTYGMASIAATVVIQIISAPRKARDQRNKREYNACYS